MRVSCPKWLISAAMLSLLIAASSAMGQSQSPPTAELSFAEAETATLEKLVEVARRQHPSLQAAAALVEAARGRMIQAGLYPNPFVQQRAGELAHHDNAWGEQGVMVTQDIVLGKKLRLARAAGAEGVRAADWQALTRWYDVLTRLRLAYFDVLIAEREVQTAEQVVRLSQEGLEVARKLLKAGAGNQPDVLRAQVELDQNRILHMNALRKSDAARRTLAAALGETSPTHHDVEGNLERPVPVFEWHSLAEETLVRSSEIHEAQANVLQAEWLWQRARAERIPNVQVSVMPFYSAPDRDMRVQVGFGANLPIFNRNQGGIHEAEANLARTQAEVRQVEIRLIERLAAAFQRYQIAREQVHSYAEKILPNAKESLRLVRLGYERGDAKYDYTTVLQAQQTLVQIQLIYVQALGAQWKAAAELAGILQRQEL